jgi:RimJ/RimL family protein N-acetyltransferase
MTPVEPLTTGRMALRPLTLDDVDHLVELDADPEVMRYISGGRASTRDEVIEVVRGSLGHRWLACDKVSTAVLGWFALEPRDPSGRERELGYRLRRSSWGQGLATEGSLAVIDWGFAQPGVERIWAETMAVNMASRRVMERCGLRYIRTFHLEWDDPIDGTELGEVEYELLRSDWLTRSDQ